MKCGWWPRILAPTTAKPNVVRMNYPLSRLATSVAYALRQLPRMAWYTGHLYVMRRLAELAGQHSGAQPSTRSDLRLKRRLNADRASLIEQDLANVQTGVYPLPADHDGSLFTMLDRSWLFFRDLPDVDARRRRSATHEVLNAKSR